MVRSFLIYVALHGIDPSSKNCSSMVFAEGHGFSQKILALVVSWRWTGSWFFPWELLKHTTDSEHRLTHPRQMQRYWVGSWVLPCRSGKLRIHGLVTLHHFHLNDGWSEWSIGDSNYRNHSSKKWLVHIELTTVAGSLLTQSLHVGSHSWAWSWITHQQWTSWSNTAHCVASVSGDHPDSRWCPQWNIVAFFEIYIFLTPGVVIRRLIVRHWREEIRCARAKTIKNA